MDIKQIRKDFDNGVLLSRCTIAELINALESDIALTTLTQRVADLEYTLRGRQAAIGELQMNISTQKEINRSLAAQLTSAEFTIAQRWHADQAGRVPKIQINPAAHDWAKPASADLPDLISRLRASIVGKESFEEVPVFVANIAAAIELLEAGTLEPLAQQRAKLSNEQIIVAWDAQRTFHGGEPCKIGHLEFARAILAAAEAK